MKKIAFGVGGFGALVLALGLILWSSSNPDYYGQAMREFAAITRNSTDPRDIAERRTMYQRVGTENAARYSACLWSSGPVCQQLGIGAVPLLNIGGILLMLAGVGLFLFGNRQRVPG